jgi:hypothetical protein
MLFGNASNRYVHLQKEKEKYIEMFFLPGYEGPRLDRRVAPTPWICFSCANGPRPAAPPLKVYLAMRGRTWEECREGTLGEDAPIFVADDRDVIFDTDPRCTFAAQLVEFNDAGRAALRRDPSGHLSIVDLVRELTGFGKNETFLGRLLRDRTPPAAAAAAAAQ